MNHPLWIGICSDCVGVGCGTCRGTGKSSEGKPHELEHLKRIRHNRKPFGLASTVDGKRVEIVRAEEVG